MQEPLLTYFVEFDQETGLFSARSPGSPIVRGEGLSLYVAIDDLEANLDRIRRRHDRLNMDLVIREKKENEVELTAKISILV